MTPKMDKWNILKNADGFIVDEAFMQDGRYFGSISTKLQEITGVSAPFGGKLIMLMGDFKQLPPV